MWIEGLPTEPGQYAVIVGAGTPVLATWNQRDGRFYDGYRRIPSEFVRAYLRIPEYREGEI